MKIKTKLCNFSNSGNGRVYSKETIESLIKNVKESGEEIFGGINRNPNNPLCLGEISHKVCDIDIDNDDVVCDIELLNTPMGNIIQEYIKNSYKYQTKCVIHDNNITSVDIYPLE